MGLFYNQFKGIENQIFGEEKKKKTEIIKDILVFLVLKTLPDTEQQILFIFYQKNKGRNVFTHLVPGMKRSIVL